MFEYGRILQIEEKSKKVCISFEKADLEVQVLSKWIVRFFTRMVKEPVVSKAVEKHSFSETHYETEQFSDRVEIRTEKLTVKIFDGGQIDIYDKKGKALCLDYRGEQSASRALDKETKGRKYRNKKRNAKPKTTHNARKSSRCSSPKNRPR